MPRHDEINEILASKICRDLEIPKPLNPTPRRQIPCRRRLTATEKRFALCHPSTLARDPERQPKECRPKHAVDAVRHDSILTPAAPRSGNNGFFSLTRASEGEPSRSPLLPWVDVIETVLSVKRLLTSPTDTPCAPIPGISIPTV